MAKMQNQVINEVRLTVLDDRSATGRKRQWNLKKMNNEKLSLAYETVNVNRARRLRDCATRLTFTTKPDGNKVLQRAFFCKVRLCPMCTWRRGLKIYAQTSKIMSKIEEQRERGYIMVTFTLKNCYGVNLSDRIDLMLYGFNKMLQRKRIKESTHGFYRGLEITHNIKSNSKDYNTYHPHIHCIFVVDKTYFRSKKYISQEEWTSLWKDVCGLDYTPIVDVRKVKGNTAKAIAEVAKYSVKDSEYIIPDDWDMTVSTIKVLDKALNKRRLVSYGGIMKYWQKRLNLDDPTDGDLVHVNPDEKEDTTGDIEIYSWCVGYNNYIRES